MGLLDNVLGGLGGDAAGGLSDLLKGQGGGNDAEDDELAHGGFPEMTIDAST